jgi:hypothetical protein
MSQHNPLLDKIKLPGRIFQLPSRGIFYEDEELSEDIKNGEIHVQAMSALDEITLKNPDQLFSGDAVQNIFKNCLTGVNKPVNLLSKDIDALMLFLRTVTYGPSYEIIAKHTCENAKEHSYIADIDKMIADMKMIDPTVIEDLYTVNLQNGQVVKLKPTIYKDTIEFIKNNSNKKEISFEDQKANLVLILLSVIKSVDGISDKTLIEEWIKKLSSPIVNSMVKKIENINNWGTDNSWECVCKDCGEKFRVEIPTNPVVFFTE